MVSDETSSGPMLGAEIELYNLRDKLYTTEEYKLAVEKAKSFGIDEDTFSSSMIDWYRGFKREARLCEGSQVKKEPSFAIKKLKEMLEAYSEIEADKLQHEEDYKKFAENKWREYEEKFRKQFDEYKEYAKKIYSRYRSEDDYGNKSINEEEVEKMFRLNKVFDRWYGQLSDVYIDKMKEYAAEERKTKESDKKESEECILMPDHMKDLINKYPQYIPVIPAMLSELTQEVKMWRRVHRLERALMRQWKIHYEENEKAGKGPKQESESTKKENYVDLEEACKMLRLAFKKYCKDLSPNYQYSDVYLEEDLRLLFKKIPGDVMLPKSELIVRRDMIGMSRTVTRRGRNALETYINRLPKAEVDTIENLPERWRVKYQEPDLVAHGLFRKLINKAKFERSEENLKQLAKNIAAVKKRHEERRAGAIFDKPKKPGLIRENPRAVELIGAGVAATVGLLSVRGKYPMSSQSEKVERGRREEDAKRGDGDKKRFGFSQVQGVALLLIAGALAFSAYKGGVFSKWVTNRMAALHNGGSGRSH